MVLNFVDLDNTLSVTRTVRLRGDADRPTALGIWLQGCRRDSLQSINSLPSPPMSIAIAAIAPSDAIDVQNLVVLR